MPLYSDMYHNYIGNTPTSPMNYTPSYSLPSYSSAYSSGYTPAPRISNISRYLPKLTPISETPLTKHRIAALSRLNSPKPTIIRRPSPRYVPPRPRRINTSDIDVSAHRFANRRISDPKVDTHYTERKKSDVIETIQENIENKPPIVDTDNTEEQPERVFGRSTIRRDRAMVRLKTVRLRSKSRSKSPEVSKEEVKEIKVKKVREYEKIEIPTEADPGYVSTETNSGSWRDNFEGEFDLKKESKSPTKSPGEILIEKHFIKDEIKDDKPLLTIDDIPVERRKSVRRRSAAKLPSFKEICSDISSDKLSDDLNAGDLRRKASLIIEEEINKIRQSASGTFHCLLEQQVSDNDDGVDKRKSRKVKKTIRQKITAKVDIENPEPAIRAVIGHVEVDETTFDNNNNKTHHPQLIDTDGSDIKNKTIKLPLKKKKTDIDTEIKSTCDSMMSMDEATNEQTPAPTTNANTKITSADIKTNESDANAKKIPVNKTENCDLDSKLLLETNATSSTPTTSAPVSVRKIKKIVKTKSLVKEVVIEPELPKMNPLKRDPSADDFWGMIGSRETIAFTKRKQKVVEEQQQKMQEISWLDEEEVQVDPSTIVESRSTKKVSKTLVDDATINPKPEVAKQVENKNESVIAAGKADVIIVSPTKADEKSNLLSKLENKMPSQMAEKQIESKTCDDIKVVKAKCDAKVAELKLGQQSKVDENKLTDNKEVVKDNADVKTALVSKTSAADVDCKKEKSLEKSPEKTFILQEVPKPKKIVSRTIEANGITDKAEEVLVLPKSPPWKLSKKTEEKLPLSPKSPSWKLKVDKDATPVESPVKKVLEKSKSPEPPKPVVLKKLEKSKSPEPPKPAVLKTLEKSPETPKPALFEKSKSPEPPKPAVLKTLEKSKSPEPPEPAVLKTLEKYKSPEPPKPTELKSLKKSKSPEPPKPAVLKTLEQKALEKSKSPEPPKTVLKSLEKVKSPEPLKPSELKALEKKALEMSKSVELSALKTVEKKTEVLPKLKPVEVKAPPTPKLEDKKKEEKVEAVETVKTPPWKQALMKNKNDKDAAIEAKKAATKIETKSPILTKPINVTAATADESAQNAGIEKVSINESKKVNENIEPTPAKVCAIKPKKKSIKSTEGQKLETKEATATSTTTNANVNDTTVANSSELKNSLSNSKSLGNLSKFPTVNNLNSYATKNDKNNDKQHQHTAIKSENTDTQISHDDHNKSNAIEQSIIESTSKSSHQTQEKETIKDTKTATSAAATVVPEKKVETESEEEDSDESSYEEDSEDWTEDEMGRKDFDPQRRVKLKFESMKKCYVKDEKATITLVARPRPLWKIRRNKHANFSSSSESETSGDENTSETRSNGDSATGSSHSSTNSNHKIQKKNGGSEVSDVMYDNITALMPTLATQDEEDENGVEKSAEQIAENELKKKNRLSTSSQDSGFCCVGATAPKSPRKMLGEFIIIDTIHPLNVIVQLKSLLIALICSN